MPFKHSGRGAQWRPPRLDSQRERESLLRRWRRMISPSDRDPWPGPDRQSMSRMSADAWNSYFEDLAE